MHRSARTAHTRRPSRSFSSTMQPATGHAAWQIEQANAPKHRSGSMTAIVFGAFLRGPVIILVHMDRNYTLQAVDLLTTEDTEEIQRGVFLKKPTSPLCFFLCVLSG